ncbi:MAG: calcium/sodium antiporter [Acidobacteria bacterium]|nr:calcium/sodium antiporter [Acidobacteriota bacterium]
MDPAAHSLLLSLLLLAGGAAMLGLGSSWLVSGASRLALGLGVTPMVVGLTVVGFGTSMPELSVSVLASLRGSSGLSLGNAVGSNIMNLLLVLGVAAVIRPMEVVGDRGALLRDLGFGLLPALVLVAGSWSGIISRPVALVLVGIFTLFLVVTLRVARAGRQERVVVGGSPWGNTALTVVGIAVLVWGADLMVRGGVAIAHRFGISDAIIGLTLVAFGTSLPELATSVAASLKGQSALSVGNVLGSNIFNLGLIVGLAFAIRPGGVPVFVIRQDIPILVAVTLIVGLGILRNGKISRREGGIMLAMFAAYFVFLAQRGS